MIPPRPNNRSGLPPLKAEFLFHLLLKPQEADAIVGDLEERYKLIYRRFGKERANRWYWYQAITSLVHISMAWGKVVFGKLFMGFGAKNRSRQR